MGTMSTMQGCFLGCYRSARCFNSFLRGQLPTEGQIAREGEQPPGVCHRFGDEDVHPSMVQAFVGQLAGEGWSPVMQHMEEGHDGAEKCLTVSFWDMTGRSILTAEFPPSATLGEAKNLVVEHLGIELGEAKLIYETQTPADHAALRSLGANGDLALTLLQVVEPEMLELLEDLHSAKRVDACLDAVNKYWGGQPEHIIERRRQLAVKLGVLEAIVQALSADKDNKDLQRRGCSALAQILKVTRADESESSAAFRRQAAADCGALDVLIALIGNLRGDVSAKEQACLALARICDASEGLEKEALAAAECRRQRSIDAGAVHALVALLRSPVTLQQRSAALMALRHVVGQNKDRIAAARVAGAEELWLCQ